MLDCQNLSYTYIRTPIFSELCFQANPGELLIIEGPNGTGKSTCLSVLVGLRELQRGQISFFPESGAKVAWSDYRGYINYVAAEANGSYPKLSAMQNLLFWQRVYNSKSDKAQCLSALEQWGLDNPLVADHLSVDRFSTGMKRRLAFARLQLLKRPIWVLDEPLYGLDKRAVEQFVALLKNHLQQGHYAIMVSHDLAPFTAIESTSVHLSASPRKSVVAEGAGAP